MNQIIKELTLEISKLDALDNPPMWHVIFLNDDFTPMDFVIEILIGVFNHSEAEATEIMLQVHHEGHAIAGTYVWEVAETKADQTMMIAQTQEYPLKVIIKPE